MSIPSRDQLETLLRQRPDDIAVLGTLATLCLKTGDIARAVPLFERIAKLRPRDVAARVNLAGCLMRLGRAAEAVAPIGEAAGLSSEDASVRFNHGRILSTLGRNVEARGELDATLQIDPRLLPALTIRARLAADAGEDVVALGDLDTALTLKPGDAGLRTLRAEICLRRGDWLNGLSEYEARHEIVGAPRYAPSLPRWNGEALPPGQRLLVYPEQTDLADGAADMRAVAAHASALADIGIAVELQADPDTQAALLATDPTLHLIGRDGLTADLAAAIPARSLPHALTLHDDATSSTMDRLATMLAKALFATR